MGHPGTIHCKDSLPDSSLKIKDLTFLYESDGRWHTERSRSRCYQKVAKSPSMFQQPIKPGRIESGEFNRARTSIYLVNLMLLLCKQTGLLAFRSLASTVPRTTLLQCLHK